MKNNYRNKLKHYSLSKGMTLLRMSRCNNNRDYEVLKNEVSASLHEWRSRGEIVHVWCEEYPDMWVILQVK